MPSLLDQKIEAVLETVLKPSRYIGGEANQVTKPTATRLIALCYPDAYEIGISNQALQILYTQVNRRDSFAAERVSSPGMNTASISAPSARRRPNLTLPSAAEASRRTTSGSRSGISAASRSRSAAGSSFIAA